MNVYSCRDVATDLSFYHRLRLTSLAIHCNDDKFYVFFLSNSVLSQNPRLSITAAGRPMHASCRPHDAAAAATGRCKSDDPCTVELPFDQYGSIGAAVLAAITSCQGPHAQTDHTLAHARQPRG
jgi:hypothetical protein